MGNFFSEERFIQAVARNETANARVVKLQSSNSSANLFGLEQRHKFNTRSISLAPFGLPAYPIYYDGASNHGSDFVAQLKTIGTRSFEWNVRFDHLDLAKELTDCGLSSVQDTTHVLYLDRSYDAIFRGFSVTVRQGIRRAERKGVVVRRSADPEHAAKYYALYRRMVGERGDWKHVYSESLFQELLRLDDVILLVAELDGRMIAGAWNIRDGKSICGWQCAMDHEFKTYSPYHALISHGINLAWGEGIRTFNLGSSAGSKSIEQFKAFWGARKMPHWRFVWENPIWSTWSRMRQVVR